MLNKVLLLLAFFPTILATGQDIQYGLCFRSYEVEKENRTGLNLTPEDPFVFREGFTLSFDVNFNSDCIHPFGSVMRIITDNQQHIDLILSEIENTGKIMISLVSSSHDILFNKPFDEKTNYDEFISIKISIDIFNKQVKAQIGDDVFTGQSSILDQFKKVNILFGKSNYPHFQTTDVPSFMLKNLRINDPEGTPLYSWALSKHVQCGVYDDIRNHFAATENAVWLQDRHAIWQKVISFQTGTNPQFCYNPDKNEIAVLDQHIFYQYNLESGVLEENSLKNALIYTSSNSNNLIYNPITKEYNCAIFDLEEGKDMYRFNTLTHDWDKRLFTSSPPDYWHHNRFFSPIDSCLYLFCGYGHHRYKNEINRYNYKEQVWEKHAFKNDRIHPRYLSGLGQLDNQHLLLFGGYGSETGYQSMSPRHFYDLHKINMRTLEASKLWEIENPQEEFIVANSIIADSDGKSFYALIFPLQQFYTKLVLVRFLIDKPEYKTVADSIPFNFEDIKSNADLYLDKSSNQLIAVVVSPQTDTNNTLSIYTLSYPPLTIHDLYQEENQKTSAVPLIIGGVFLFLITTGITILILYKKRKKGDEQQTHEPSLRQDRFEPSLSYEPQQKSSVNLFGGFQVFDKDGNDVTKEFTPMLKQLFISLLLYTAKSGKGISSAKLKDILWYDKSEESAKNNRGVFVNKLRQIFEQIGPIYIKSQDLYWSIELGETIYCDYVQVLLLMEKLEKAPEKAEDSDVQMLLSVASKGELLPNMQTEWVDGFKSDFSNNLIDLLSLLYKHSDIQKRPSTCIHLADSIFIHDPLNEEALSIKCYNLVQMGKYGLAQKVYTSFRKEYKYLFDEEFKTSFEQVIRHS